MATKERCNLEGSQCPSRRLELKLLAILLDAVQHGEVVAKSLGCKRATDKGLEPNGRSGSFDVG